MAHYPSAWRYEVVLDEQRDQVNRKVCDAAGRDDLLEVILVARAVADYVSVDEPLLAVITSYIDYVEEVGKALAPRSRLAYSSAGALIDEESTEVDANGTGSLDASETAVIRLSVINLTENVNRIVEANWPEPNPLPADFDYLGILRRQTINMIAGCVDYIDALLVPGVHPPGSSSSLERELESGRYLREWRGNLAAVREVIKQTDAMLADNAKGRHSGSHPVARNWFAALPIRVWGVLCQFGVWLRRQWHDHGERFVWTVVAGVVVVLFTALIGLR